MKAKLRAGKTGAKGIVKKYADGGMLGDPRASAGFSQPTSSTPDSNMSSAFGAFNSQSTGVPAPTQTALQSLSGSSMGTPQGGLASLAATRTPPPALGPSGAGVAGGSSAPPPMVGPRGFGPNDGGPRPGMGRPGMGRYEERHRGMGKPGTGGVNVGPRPLTAMTPGAQVMPGGRAFKKGGMVGCDWSPKSSATMRGAARKGK